MPLSRNLRLDIFLFTVIALQDLLDMEQYEELDDVDESPGLDISMETK